MTIYCSEQSHAETDLGPFLKLDGDGAWWDVERAVGIAPGVFAVAVMELNRSEDETLTAAMKRGPETFGLWTVATDIPHESMVIHTPKRRSAEMLTVSDGSAVGRVRIRLRCGWCGLSYERRMPEFCAQLDVLASNGIAAVALRSLIATK